MPSGNADPLHLGSQLPPAPHSSLPLVGALPCLVRRCLLQRFSGLVCSVALLKLLRENKS